MATMYNINELGGSETRRQIDIRTAELLAATVLACAEWADEFRSLQLEVCRDRLRWELKRDSSNAAFLHDICHLMPLLNREIDDLHAAHEDKLAQTIAKYEQDLREKALEVDTLAGQVAKVASALEATRSAQKTELASLADRLKQQIAVAQEGALRDAETAHQDVQRLSAKVLKLEALAKSLIAAVSPVNMTLTLDLDPITVGDERSPQRATLDRALTEEITAAASSSVGQCGAEMQCTLFVRTSCSSGSLEVDLEIHASPMGTSGRGASTGDDPVSIAADLQRQAHDKASALMASPLAGKMRRVSVLGKQLLLDKLHQTREELMAQHEISCMAHARIQEQKQSLERANKEVSSLTTELKEELVKGAGKVSQIRETLQSVRAASAEQLRLAEVNAQEMAHAAAAAQERLRADLTEQLSVMHCQLTEAHEELKKAQTCVIAQEEEAAAAKAELQDDLWERLSAEIEKRRLAEASWHEKEEEEQQLREELERMSYEKVEHVSALLDKSAEDSRLMASLQEEVATLKGKVVQLTETKAQHEEMISQLESQLHATNECIDRLQEQLAVTQSRLDVTQRELQHTLNTLTTTAEGLQEEALQTAADIQAMHQSNLNKMQAALRQQDAEAESKLTDAAEKLERTTCDLQEELVRGAKAAEEARTGKEQLCSDVTAAQILATRTQEQLWLAEFNAQEMVHAAAAAKERLHADLTEQLYMAHCQLKKAQTRVIAQEEEAAAAKAELHEEVAAPKRKLIRGANEAEGAMAGDEQLSSDVTVLKDEIASLGVKSVKRRILTEFQALSLQQMRAELMQTQEMMAAEAETAMLQSLQDTLHEEKCSLEKRDVQSSRKREIEVKVWQGQHEMQQSISERELAAVQREINTLLSVDSALSSNLQGEEACARTLAPQTRSMSEIKASNDSDGALEKSAQARVLLEAGAKLSARLLGFCDELHSVLESIREETLDAQEDLDLVSEEMARLAQENEMLRCACKVAAQRARLLEEEAQKRHETRDERGSEAAGVAARLLNLWTRRLNPLQIVEKGQRRGVEGERAVQNIEVDVVREEGEEEMEDQDLFKADAVVEVDAEEEDWDADEEEGSSEHTGHTLNEGVASVQSAPLKAGATGGNETPSMMHLFHTNTLMLCANPRSRPARDAMGRKEVQAAKVAVEEEEGTCAISNEGHDEPDRERRRRACDLWHKQ